jgi:hypothetical protein
MAILGLAHLLFPGATWLRLRQGKEVRHRVSELGDHAGILGGRTSLLRPCRLLLPSLVLTRGWRTRIGTGLWIGRRLFFLLRTLLRRALPVFRKGVGRFSRLTISGGAIRLILLCHPFLRLVALEFLLQFGEFLFDVAHDLPHDLLEDTGHRRSQVKVRVQPVSHIKQAGGHDGGQDCEIDGAWKLKRYGLAEVYIRGDARRPLLLCLPRPLIAAAIRVRTFEEHGSR